MSRHARLRSALCRRGLFAAASALACAGAGSVALSAGAAAPASAQPHYAHATRVANPYGRAMFGLASSGRLQNERGRTFSRDMNATKASGARWLRVDINWASIQSHGARSFDWTGSDKVIRAAQRRGIKVLGVLIYTPAWAAASSSCRQPDCAPDPAAFARFAAIAAARYAKRGVDAYEVWSEENSTAQWLPKPNPAAYTALLRDGYPAIKQADPRATVLTGGTSPAPTDGTNYSPQDFLSALYRAGAGPYFDAVGAHPYCWPAYAGQAYEWSSWYRMYGLKHSMRAIMVAHGDARKRIWGTEFGAATYGPKGSYVSPRVQAKMITVAYRLWGTYRWAGPLFLFEARDEAPATHRDTVWNYLGLSYHNFKRKPAFAAYRRAAAHL
jgi:hypothetical protein